MIEAWTDGACHPNPHGFGGWGVVLSFPGKPLREMSGHQDDTTNNRMELTAVIRALQATPASDPIRIYLDSEYVCNPYRKKWILGWRQMHFAGRPNSDLWLLLDSLVLLRNMGIEWVWVRGHQDNINHNRADELAVAARLMLRAEMEAAGVDW